MAYKLLLFVAGHEPNSVRARENLPGGSGKTSRTARPNSVRARENLQAICDTYLDGRYELEVIDVLEDFRRAQKHNVLVTPTLIVLEPEPSVMIVGTLSDEEKVTNALRV